MPNPVYPCACGEENPIVCGPYIWCQSCGSKHMGSATKAQAIDEWNGGPQKRIMAMETEMEGGG